MKPRPGYPRPFARWECFWCGALLVWRPKDEYAVCPECGSEFWVKPLSDERARDVLESLKRIKANREALRGHISSVRAQMPVHPYAYVPGAEKGGGSKSGRKRKKPKKAKSYVEEWDRER